jgi:zinc ribbon protein
LAKIAFKETMYCPKCGQQQISDEMRFCSRCGLALRGLTEWMAGSDLPAKPADQEQNGALSRRRIWMRRAAKLMFFSGVLLPVFLAISLAVDEAGPLILPLLVFFVALVVMLYARLFLDATTRRNTEATNALNSGAQTSGLPSGSARGSLTPANMPIATAGRQQVRTNELAQPPSVTENTTRLLDNE